MMYAGSELTAFFAVLGLAGPDKLFLESLFLRFGKLLQHPGSSFAAPLVTRSTSYTIFQWISRVNNRATLSEGAI